MKIRWLVKSAMLCSFIRPELLRNMCLNCLQPGETAGLSSDSLHTLNTCITEHANYFDHHNDDCGPLITWNTHAYTQIQVRCGRGLRGDKAEKHWQRTARGKNSTGNRRRGVNDNAEYDWGRFMGFCTGFCMERQIFLAPTQCYDWWLLQ